MIGAILLGVTQQLLAVTISSEVNVLVLGVMLVLFVVAAPEGYHRPVPHGSSASRGGRSMMSSIASEAPLLRIDALDQALRRLHRARQCQRRYSPGRALRPDRSERLGKDDADQLHFRRVPYRTRAPCMFRDEDITPLAAASCAPAAASRAASRFRGRSRA